MEDSTSGASQVGMPKPTDCSIPLDHAHVASGPVDPPPQGTSVSGRTASDERRPVVAMEAMEGEGPLNVDIPLAMEPTDDDEDIDAELHLHDDMAMPMEQDHLKRSADVLEQDATEVDDEEPQSKRPRAAMV